MPKLDIRITALQPPGSQGGIRAHVSMTIDDCFGVRGIKVVEGGKNGLFVAMPSRKTENTYKDICYPVTAEFRQQINEEVLQAYHQAVAMVQTVPGQEQETLEAGQTVPQAHGPQMTGV